MTDWTAKHPWWLDALLLKVGLITRTEATRRGVPHIKAGTPEQTELDLYQTWALWRAKGAVPPRPVILKGWKPEPEYWTALAAYLKKHKLPPAPPPDPEHQPSPPSWTLPSALIMTASDPGSATGHAGVGTIGRIIEQGICPLWECFPEAGSGRGLLGQIEGDAQLDEALRLMGKHRQPGDHLAIVGTGGVNAKRMIEFGCNVAFYELNAQASVEPYANTARLMFQGHQDGWPYVYPSYGCYDGWGLQDYRDYVPMVWSNETNGFVPGSKPQGLEPYFACFSAEGMGDTNSWPALALT